MKTGLYSVLLCTAQLLCTVGCSRVQLAEDGGYRGIVLRVHPGVRKESCANLIKNIKSVISESSGLLYTATGGRVWFGQLTIVLPPLWTDTQCQTEIKYPSENIPYKGEDIGVVGEDPIYGSLPVTEQSRACGQPADRIRLTEAFVSDLNRTRESWGNPAMLLIKEWSKFRYGVFDDQGYPGDPLYPEHVVFQDRVLPTGTTNAMVRGSWLFQNSSQNCDPRVNHCFFKPEGRNDQVTCSINFLPFLPSVKNWCEPDHIVSPISPTKHNVLCNGKSVLQVINSHPDMVSAGGRAAAERGETVFNIVRQPPPQYVIVLETSSPMAQVWKWVRKALQNLIRFELPDNTRVAIVTFNKDTRIEQNLSILTSELVRTRVADTIPDSPNKLSRLADRCVNCAVQAAMDLVLKNREAGGHILLVTQGDSSTLSNTDETIIAGYESFNNIRISSLILPLSGDPLPFYQMIADRSGGRSIVIAEPRAGIVLLSDLIVSLRRLVGQDSQVPQTVHTNIVARQPGSLTTTGRFLLDSTLGRDTRFGVFVEKDEDHKIKWIKLTDQAGGEYGPYLKMSSDFDIINFKTINFGIGDQLPFQEVGVEWTYEIEWFPETKQTSNVILVSSKPRSADPSNQLETKTWISTAKPPVLYVKVTLGGFPVHNARVELVVRAGAVRAGGVGAGAVGAGGVGGVGTGAGGEAGAEGLAGGVGEPGEGITLVLTDDGVGDPDLQSGDGIYSRFLPRSPPQAGKLHLHLSITDNRGKAFMVSPGPSILNQPKDIQIPVCCGSRVVVPENRRKRLGIFQRNHSLELDADAVTAEEDTVAPAKIGDFSIDRHDENLTLHWTAVGGDGVDGESAVYRVYFAADLSDLLTNRAEDFEEFTGSWRGPAGTRSNHSLGGGQRQGLQYVGIQAGDLAGNFGKISNLIAVDFGEVGGPPVPEPEPSLTGDWSLVGIIVGVILVLVLCLMVLVISVMCGRRSRKFKSLRAKTKSSGVNVHIPSPTRSDATDVSYDSDHQLVPTMSKPPSHTSFANNLTPTYWSASQLLSEHEQRTGTLGRKSTSNSGYNSANNNQEFNSSNNNQDYNGYTITPLNVKPTHYSDYSDYGGSSGVLRSPYAGYSAGHHHTTAAVVDYGTVVLPHNLEEFSHLDYGVVTHSDQEFTGSDIADGDPSPRTGGGNLTFSDVSASTLPAFNQSLRGSLISLNSAKKKNITQV